jgi:hypothetical protein
VSWTPTKRGRLRKKWNNLVLRLKNWYETTFNIDGWEDPVTDEVKLADLLKGEIGWPEEVVNLTEKEKTKFLDELKLTGLCGANQAPENIHPYSVGKLGGSFPGFDLLRNMRVFTQAIPDEVIESEATPLFTVLETEGSYSVAQHFDEFDRIIKRMDHDIHQDMTNMYMAVDDILLSTSPGV